MKYLETVLVVDDQELIIRSMRRMMKGVRVVGTTQFAEVLPLARRERPQLAIIDVFMPTGCGIGLVPDLRREFPDISIGMMSALIESYDLMESILASADWFLDKSFGKFELREVIEQSGKLPLPPYEEEVVTYEEGKWKVVKTALGSTGGNKTAAARKLGITRQALQNLIKRREENAK